MCKRLVLILQVFFSVLIVNSEAKEENKPSNLMLGSFNKITLGMNPEEVFKLLKEKPLRDVGSGFSIDLYAKEGGSFVTIGYFQNKVIYVYHKGKNLLRKIEAKEENKPSNLKLDIFNKITLGMNPEEVFKLLKEKPLRDVGSGFSIDLYAKEGGSFVTIGYFQNKVIYVYHKGKNLLRKIEAKEENKPSNLKLDIFNKITLGMNPEEVFKVIKEKPLRDVGSGFSIDLYIIEDGSFVTVGYSQNKVIYVYHNDKNLLYGN